MKGVSLFFDEIQIVDGWEVYIRGKLDEGFYVGITGSNASMLSRELGTKLTGRHITKELFPFRMLNIAVLRVRLSVTVPCTTICIRVASLNTCNWMIRMF